MDAPALSRLRGRFQGILPVVQTPFIPQPPPSPSPSPSSPSPALEVDHAGLRRVAQHAIESGACGLLCPAVASELALLTNSERQRVLSTVAEVIAEARASGRAVLAATTAPVAPAGPDPAAAAATATAAATAAAAAASPGPPVFLAGASSEDSKDCCSYVRMAAQAGADAVLVAVPASIYALRGATGGQDPGASALHRALVTFFKPIGAVCATLGLPLLIQDLEFNGGGLQRSEIELLAAEALPPNVLLGFKVETAPAGPKYTLCRELLGRERVIAGGWAVQQMIEALDRGVDAMIPEASMVLLYATIEQRHRRGDRDGAVQLFRRLLPVLAFTNQTLAVSVAFFKRLLKAKGLIACDAMRLGGFAWDDYNARIADELIALVLALEAEVKALAA